MIFDDTTPICLSGGADGADLQFGMCAGMAGHRVIHWTFEGHRSQAPRAEIFELTPQQLWVADPFLEKANRTLGRRFPTRSPFANNLLRRNYYQVAWSDSVYAVAQIEKGLVSGGTSWAVQMFLDRFEDQPARAFVFCQDAGRWFTWDGYGWMKIDQPPTPDGVYAGIGSRKLRQNGKEAIRSLLGYQPVQITA